MEKLVKNTLSRDWQCAHSGGGLLVLVLFFWLVSCPVSGQGKPNRVATEADYNLWGNMYFENISDYGNWISYRMQYDELPDTLVVQHTKSRVKFKFLEADGKFQGEKWFTAKHGDTLDLLDLATGKTRQLTGIMSYALSSDNTTLLTIEKQEAATMFCISKPSGGTIEKIPNVSAFSMAPTNDAVVYKSGNKVIWLPLDGTKSPWEIEAGSGDCHFAWQSNGKSFAFVSKGEKENQVFHAIPKEKKIHIFSPSTMLSFPSGKQIATGSLSQLTISNDGQRIFFGLLDPGELTKYNGKEIKVWNGNDKYFYPQKNRVNNFAGWPKMAAWMPVENRFLLIGSTERPYIFFNATMDYAITYSPYEIGPQYIEVPNTNYYLTHLRTGQTRLLLENQSNVHYELSVSPNGKYLAYIKGADWWIYEFDTGKHTNITNGKIPDLVDAEGFENYAFGVAAWGLKDSSLLVYDQNDIWEIGLEKAFKKRLTKGKEKGVTYRIAFTVSELNGKRNFDWRFDHALDTKKGILLKAVTDTTRAYYFRDAKGKLNNIDNGSCGLLGIIKAPRADAYVWQSETFNDPPEFRTKNLRDNKYRVVEKSNRHHKNFLWREPEIIRYKNNSGNNLNGILYYPADYDTTKKYPMVVHIYQKQFYHLYLYDIPSLYKDDGFNIQHLTAHGYFVFEPDITSHEGEPGMAALDCVESGVKAVIVKGSVLPNSVALIGHSFGGYETNYIATRSGLFACAISGAGISDAQSFYLGISIWLGRPEIWRLETQQWDMKKSLFEDRRRYERNSPMTYVADIKTPILQWTGEADNNVNPNQSYAFYVALRRLNKEQMLVTYPNEKHGLVNPKNQKDLSKKTDDWLAFYLKKELPAQWIADGIK
ncbi:prolyl oligopeptidase family serine peptidase [Flavobacterium sp.]|uniref:S9 family peptidase n=1 Tax=Flavobacterium sp. TaxID=239 RepID=UPI0039E598ED